MDGLKVFIGGNADALKKTIREADYAIKGFVNQNKQALKSLEKLGAPAAIGFAGLTLGIGAAVKKFGDFQATLNRVQAVSGATAAEMEALKTKAAELGAATKFSGQEAASGMEELAKAGFNAKQTMEAIPGVLQLAAAGGVSVAQAAELAGGTIRGFGLAMGEAGRVADVMAQAANQSSVDIGDLQLTMKYVAPVASSASQSLEEMSGAIAIMGNNMIKGEQAGTTLRAALTRLQDPPKEAAETLSKLGIAVSDTKGKMLPLGDIVDQLRTKTAKMTEVQRNAAIAQVFGTEALSGMLTLVKATPAEYEAMVASMRDAEGAAKKMSDTINSGFNGAMDQLMASVESAGLAVGENLAPAILAVAGAVKGGVDAFNAMPGPLKTLAVGAAAGGAALLGMVGAAGLLLPVLANVRAALFAMNTLALTPVGATIAALALTVGLATVAFKAHADAVDAARKKEADARQARIDHTTQIAAQKTELEKLGKEYASLADKAKLSKDEQKRLKEIQDKLAKDYPEIAKVIAAGATAHDKVEAAVQREIAAKKDLLNLDRVAAQQRVMSDAHQLGNERRKLVDLKAQYEAAKGAPSYGDSAGRVQELNVLGGMIAAQERAVDSINARVLASAAELQRVSGIVIPGPTPVKPKRGAAVTVPGSSGGKSAAEKAADEAHRAQVDQLGKLSAAYQRNLGIAQKWGGGSAAEVNGLTKLIADIRAKGLDKIPEGYEAIINASARLKESEGERIVAGQKADKALTAAMDEGATKTAGVVDAFKALFSAIGPVTDKMKELRDAKAAAEFRQSIRDMQGDLVALGTDPSLERLANFAKTVAQDEEKLNSWGKAVGDIGKAFGGADGKAQDFGAALGKVVSNIDPVSLAVSSLVLLVNTLTGAWEAAAEAQRKLAEVQKTAGRKALDRRITSEKDPSKRAALVAERDTADLQAEVNAMVERARPGLVDAEFRRRLEAMVGADTNDAARIRQEVENEFSYERVLDALPDVKRYWDDGLKDIRDAAEAAGKEGASTAVQSLGDIIGGFVSEQIAQAVAAGKKFAEDYAQAIADRDEVSNELNAGGRDSWGNRISLERERDLKIQEATAALEEKRADAVKRERDLFREIHQINEDERAAIAGIENEGIAVRAVSEAQDKTARIEKVKAEAKAKRDAKTDEIAAIQIQMDKEAEATAKAISNIRILATERVTQLNAELERLKKITDQMERQAEIAKHKANGTYQAAVNSGGQIDGSKVVNGTTATNMSGDGRTLTWDGVRWNGAATGGMVAGGIRGKDSVPVMAMPGEVIVSEPVTRGLAAMVNAFQQGHFSKPMPQNLRPAPAAGPTFGDIHLTVNAAPGMNERQVADAVWSTISTRLRRAGLGR